MRILVTGGQGFIGGRLAQYLVLAGHQIDLGSRTVASSPSWAPQVSVVQMDWLDRRSLEHVCTGVDVVIHAAGMNAQDCSADPVAALDFNGLATARLAASANSAGVGRFIYLSTAHVYSSPLVGAITEDTCPRNVHSYASSHLAGENAVLAHNHNGSMTGIVLRLSNALGAPVHRDVNCWMLLVNDLCRQAVTSRSLVLRTAGLQRRDFVTLTDVSRAISHVIDLNNERIGNAIFNVGGAWAPSVLEMAKIIQTRCSVILGYTPNIACPDPIDAEVTVDLEYKIAGLLSSGYSLTGQSIAEIDSLLIFCSENFEQIS
jgi:UDP-glucose 4-epimerase